MQDGQRRALVRSPASSIVPWDVTPDPVASRLDLLQHGDLEMQLRRLARRDCTPLRAQQQRGEPLAIVGLGQMPDCDQPHDVCGTRRGIRPAVLPLVPLADRVVTALIGVGFMSRNPLRRQCTPFFGEVMTCCYLAFLALRQARCTSSAGSTRGTGFGGIRPRVSRFAVVPGRLDSAQGLAGPHQFDPCPSLGKREAEVAGEDWIEHPDHAGFAQERTESIAGRIRDRIGTQANTSEGPTKAPETRSPASCVITRLRGLNRGQSMQTCAPMLRQGHLSKISGTAS